MNKYGKNKDSSCLKYQDVNNMYGWATSQNSQVCGNNTNQPGAF